MSLSIQGTIYDASTLSGIAGVLVSNGETVVSADGKGQYSLSIQPGTHRFVTITVPDSYRPDGSFFRCTHSWQHNLDDIDFFLLPAPERAIRDFSLAHISDTHLIVKPDDHERSDDVQKESLAATQNSHEARRRKIYTLPSLHEYPSRSTLAEDLRRVEEVNPDLVIATGDLTNIGSTAELSSYRDAINTITPPVVSVFGGHDGNEERVEGRVGSSFTGNYESVLGPTYYSFDWAGRHIVLYAQEEQFFSPADQRRKERWLWADLGSQPAAKEIILVMHTPPEARFLDRLNDFRVRAVLHGHAHSSKVWSHRKIVVFGTPTLCFGAIDTRPPSFRLIHFVNRGFRASLISLPGSDRSATAISPPVITITNNGGCLQRRWDFQVPGGVHRASPVNCNASLLVSMQDESYPTQSGVSCLDVATGNLRWQTRIGAAIKNSVAVPPVAECLPLKDAQSRCVAVSVTGQISTLSTEDGKLLWQDMLPGYPQQAIFSSPVIGDGVVYLAATESCAAYDLRTGNQLWQAPLEQATARSYAEPKLCGELLVILIPEQGLLALYRSNGKVAWTRPFSVKYYCAGPVVVSGNLVVTGEGGDTAVCNARSGEIIWEAPGLLGSYAAGLAVDVENIYVTTGMGEAQAYELRSGQMLWRFQAGEALVAMAPYRRQGRSLLAAPVIWEDCVVVGGLDGLLYLLNKTSGTCISRTPFGSPISATPCATNDSLYVGTYNGNLIAYSG